MHWIMAHESHHVGCQVLWSWEWDGVGGAHLVYPHFSPSLSAIFPIPILWYTEALHNRDIHMALNRTRLADLTNRFSMIYQWYSITIKKMEERHHRGTYMKLNQTCSVDLINRFSTIYQ